MLGDIKGGLRTTATGLIGIAAIGAGMHAQSSKRVRAAAQKRTIEALNSAPEYSEVNPDRLLALLSSNTSLYSRSDLIDASNEAPDLDLEAALARRIHNMLPFDGDDEATKHLAYLALEAGIRACKADKEFQNEVQSAQLTHLVQTALGTDQKLNTLIKQSADKARELHLTEQLFISLARRIATDVTNIDQAHRELEHVVEVASDEQAKSALPSNTDEAVTVILARVDELNNEGQIDVAAELIADEEAQLEADLMRLYDKGIAQAILTRDSEAACAYELKKLPLDAPESVQQFGALRQVQDVWYERGRDKGLNFDLEVSIELARRSYSRASDTDQRGTALLDLGLALRVLGEREGDPGRLEEAVVTYRAALEELTRECVPLDWAEIQNNLGVALELLGRRKGDPERLEEAVAAYCAALEEYTQDRVPLDWAATQNNLGLALEFLGRQEDDPERLEEVIVAFRSVLEERTRERVPLDWAATQNNLGNALQFLGLREDDPERLEEAIAAYRAALEERTRERVPLDWATTQSNLGGALWALGKRESDPGRLEEAIAAYRAALEESTRERVPLGWAGIRYNLALAEMALADHSATTYARPHVEAVLEHLNAALEIFDVNQTPFEHEQATRLRDRVITRLTSDD